MTSLTFIISERFGSENVQRSGVLIALQGKHAYKFVVDDEWRFAPDQVKQISSACQARALFAYHNQPTISDIEGRINNYIDVSEFTPYVGDINFFDRSKGNFFIYGLRHGHNVYDFTSEQKIPDTEFHRNIPHLDEVK
jgi:hypothetical protein